MTLAEIKKAIHLGVSLGKSKRQILLDLGQIPGIKQIDRETSIKAMAYMDGVFYALDFARHKLLALHAGKMDLGTSDPSIMADRILESQLQKLEETAQ